MSCTARIRFLTRGMLVLAVLLSPAAGAPPEQGAADQAFDSSARDYLAGNGLLNRGLYDLAIDEYRRFLQRHPEHEKAPLARYGLAVALFRSGRLDEAAGELARLPDGNDFDYAAEAATMTGQCHLAGGRFDEAAEAFSAVTGSMPDHDLADDAAAGLVEALYREGQHGGCVTRADRFVSRWPDNPLRERVDFFAALSQLAASEFAGAATRLEDFLKRFPRSAFASQASLRLAQCLQKTGADARAVEQYQDVLERQAEAYVPDALFSLGGLFYRQGRHDDAAQSLDRLLEGDSQTPSHGRALLLRGHVHFAQDAFDEAVRAFEAAAAFDPDLADRCAFWAAKARLRQDKFAQAAKRLAEATEQYPTSPLLPEMHYDHAVALIRAGRDAEAAPVLERFASAFSEHALAPGALHLLAGITHKNGEYDRSLAHCDRFSSRFADDPLAGAVAFLAAENEFLSGRFDQAVERYRRFLEAFHSNPQADVARYRLAISLYRLEAFDEAQPLLTEVTAAASDPTFRPALLALGDIHFRRGEWKQAETNLDRYLASGDRTDSPADEARIKRAYARQQQKRYEAALDDYDRHLATFDESPNRLQAMFERGQILAALDRPDEAEKAFEQVLATGGDDSRFGPFALNHLGTIALRRGKHQEAATFYERAGRSSDGDLSARLLFQEAQAHMAAGTFARAEASLRKLLDKHPGSEKSAQAAAQLAIALSRQERYEEALSAIERIEQASATNLPADLRASLQYEKAWSLRALGRNDESAAAYRTLLADSPDSGPAVHAMLELGEIEAGRGRFEPAATVLRELQEHLGESNKPAHDGIHGRCLYRLGVCEFELQRFEAAADVLEQLLSASPEGEFVASASFLAGEANFKLGRHERAIQHFTRVAEQHASDASAGPSLLRLGECLAVLQRWAASERVFEDYLSRFGDSDTWYQARFGVAWARENQKRYDAAVDDYEKVVGRHKGPTAARAQFQIGQCLFAKGDLDGAVRELLKVDILYAYPQWSAAAIYEAGRCFDKLGNPAEARSHFKQVVEKYKDTDWARMARRRLDELASSAALPGR